MRPVSVCIICQNEEDSIGRLLESVQLVADEIVIVDSGSTDATESVCRRFTTLFLHHDWAGYRAQKQFATDRAHHEWVLSLDADEQLSEALQAELMAWKKGSDPEVDGYTVPRLTNFLGGWIRHTSWYPDRQLRLFNKNKGQWTGGRVHESFRVAGELGAFQSDLLHWTYASISEYLRKLDQFSSLAARDYLDQGRKSGVAKLALYPLHTFLVNFVLRRGFLDGVPGLAVSLLSGVSVLMKYLKLWELQQTSPRRGAGL